MGGREELAVRQPLFQSKSLMLVAGQAGLRVPWIP